MLAENGTPLEAAQTAAKAPEIPTPTRTRRRRNGARSTVERLTRAVEALPRREPSNLEEWGEAVRRFRQLRGVLHSMNTDGRVAERVPRDTADVGTAIKRLIMSMARRAQTGDLEALTVLAELRATVQEATVSAAQSLHVDHSYTWLEVGRAYGISRQAAEQRWGDS